MRWRRRRGATKPRLISTPGSTSSSAPRTWTRSPTPWSPTDRILDRWLSVASRQPFHAERPDHSVSDHIPHLFDAVVEVLRHRRDLPDDESAAPLDDEAVSAAAIAYAQVRFDQGLGPVAIVTEFRILRQEIGRAMATQLDARMETSDAVAGITLVGDALDGAATVGLSALSDRIETLRESFLATSLHDVRQPITLVEGSLHLADRWLADPRPTRRASTRRCTMRSWRRPSWSR